MRFLLPLTLLLTLLGAFTGPALAHFHILLPKPASAKRGEPVAFIYRFGHPFEHQFFDASLPERLFMLAPDGTKTDLLGTLEKDPSQKKVKAFHLQFTPEQRGDFLCILQGPPLWMEEDGELLQDTVKVVLHVQAQKGWDRSAGLPFEMTPLTRPYGLQPGMVFQAQALADGKPLAGSLVEIERFNPAAPKELPAEELITRTTKTDPNGIATCTLTDPGWWCITAQREHGKKEHKGKAYPLRQRATLWVFVDPK